MEPIPGAGRRKAPTTHHIFDLAVPVAEDDGVGGVAHGQHHCKGDAHGDWDQGVEWINVQRFRLGEERIHRDISVQIMLAFLGLSIANTLSVMAWCWPTLAGYHTPGVVQALPSKAYSAGLPRWAHAAHSLPRETRALSSFLEQMFHFVVLV